MQSIDCAGGIVLNPNKDILVITNQIGKHTFPKGTCKDGELPVETALREIEEESGLIRVEIVKFLGTLIRPGYTAEKSDVPSVEKHIKFYHCISNDVELYPIAPDAVHAQWVYHGDLGDLLTWPEELAFFEAHQSELGF